MVPTQPPIKRLPGITRPVREDDYSPPASSKVKNGGAIPPLPHTSLPISAIVMFHVYAQATAGDGGVRGDPPWL
jgi:hypothetical protein